MLIIPLTCILSPYLGGEELYFYSSLPNGGRGRGGLFMFFIEGRLLRDGLGFSLTQNDLESGAFGRHIGREIGEADPDLERGGIGPAAQLPRLFSVPENLVSGARHPRLREADPVQPAL